MPDDHLQKMGRGWILPYLITLDTIDAPEHNYKGHGRWTYWLDACERGVVPEGPIPKIHFRYAPARDDEKHVQKVLRTYVERGVWYDEAWMGLVRWLLHGFGRREVKDDVERIPPEVRNTWYEQFDLGVLLRSPCDWSAHVLQGGLPAMKDSKSRWADATGYFPTPMPVCHLMAEMTFMGRDPEQSKIETCCDPCCGTGSLLLTASNYSLRLYGQDIVLDLCLCADLNAWLWMPWLAYMPPHMEQLFDSLANPAPIGLMLETRPERVKATQAYRAGELSQVDFFATLGVESR